ncbi:hypothetical protein QAD02_010961 [Eretmocerus hayati]|uniref:Uncharacterized protein n=1 Tax=Eretmocerus hayati TaxID=131215 RepID=A0ACC2NVA7_9HYME|nr:hypothetical protein QAD02_010961 [Eretmocerus hayati]
MPSYKLTYFPLKGRAEPIRLLLSYAGVEFIDDRIEFKDWPEIKHTTPLGQLPVLEIDDRKVYQSNAICRYLAKQFGLAGKNDWEALEIDATVDTIFDCLNKIVDYHYEAHPEAKAQKCEKLEELIPFYIRRLDEQVKKNEGYLVGGALTWADLVFVGLLDSFNFMSKRDVIEKAKELKALQQKVLDIPNIKAWVAKRPDSFPDKSRIGRLLTE